MIHDIITKELRKAFLGPLKDVYKDFVLIRKTYLVDPRTDKNIETKSEFTGKGVFGSFEAKDIDGENILVTDIKLLVLQEDLSTKPQRGDIINSLIVRGILKDSADVTYTLILRGHSDGLEP